MKKTESAHDSLISDEETKKISFQLDCGPKSLKGILIAIPITIAIWCIVFSLAIVIF